MRKKYSSPELFKHYVSKGGTLDYKDWRRVITMFNDMSMDRIIYHAEVLTMGKGLSNLMIIKMERDFTKPIVDWNETMKYKKELIDEGVDIKSKENPKGQNYFVYFVGDDPVYKFYWEKKSAVIRNKSAYRFDASRGLKGQKTKLTQHIQEDALNERKYPLVSLSRK